MFSKLHRIYATVPEPTARDSGDAGSEHRIAPRDRLRGNTLIARSAALVGRKPAYVARVIKATPRIVWVGPRADPFAGNVGVKRLRAHSEQGQCVRGAQPDARAHIDHNYQA